MRTWGVGVGAETGAEKGVERYKDAFCVSEWRIVKMNTSVHLIPPKPLATASIWSAISRSR